MRECGDWVELPPLPFRCLQELRSAAAAEDAGRLTSFDLPVPPELVTLREVRPSEPSWSKVVELLQLASASVADRHPRNIIAKAGQSQVWLVPVTGSVVVVTLAVSGQLVFPRAARQPRETEGAVAMTRRGLEAAFQGEDPAVLEPMTDEFLRRKLNTPGSRKRTFEKNLNRLIEVCTWRLQRRPWTIPRSAVSPLLDQGALQWRGYTATGSPVLYARPGQVKVVDPAELERAHAWAFERGLCLMGPGVSGFVVVVDTGGLQTKHCSVQLCRLLRPMLTEGFSARLDACVAGPASVIAKSVWKALKLVLPSGFSSRVKLSKSPRHELIAAGLLQDDAIPAFVV
eukprot:TRINITY_DN16521_c0_g1_i1.p1 TRINITY_DN16521_c0_g1~~TRINITY_DN16521_c0_g1_i1.p1  ORF type:complete len:343 (+),score=73.91 TRINITY_DN16521_c0_g1_i1:45-1073(+)